MLEINKLPFLKKEGEVYTKQVKTNNPFLELYRLWKEEELKKSDYKKEKIKRVVATITFISELESMGKMFTN